MTTSGTTAASPSDHAEIDLGDVVLHRWDPSHAEALAESIAANLDHLRPWMPWVATEPLELDERRDLLRRWKVEWDVGGDRHWGIFSGGRALGSLGLMGAGVGCVAMGYWIDRRHTGRGIVTRAARALTTVAFDNPRIQRISIHHDQANRASAAVPRRLGYHLVAERPRERTAPGECGVDCVWEMTSEAWFALRPRDGPAAALEP